MAKPSSSRSKWQNSSEPQLCHLEVQRWHPVMPSGRGFQPQDHVLVTAPRTGQKTGWRSDPPFTDLFGHHLATVFPQLDIVHSGGETVSANFHLSVKAPHFLTSKWPAALSSRAVWQREGGSTGEGTGRTQASWARIPRGLQRQEIQGHPGKEAVRADC